MKSISSYLQAISFFLGNYFILSQVIFSFLCPGYFHSLAWPIFIPCLAYFHSLAWDIFILLPSLFSFFILMPSNFILLLGFGLGLDFFCFCFWVRLGLFHSCLGYF